MHIVGVGAILKLQQCFVSVSPYSSCVVYRARTAITAQPGRLLPMVRLMAIETAGTMLCDKTARLYLSNIWNRW